ncbi:MAG: hypothetical protein ACYC0C_12145 [Devosia sp.]
MLDTKQIDDIVKRAARSHFPTRSVQRVFSEPTIDSQGREALRFTIVVAPDALETVEDDALLETLVQIRRDLDSAGEERFPIINYATQAELDDASAEP